MPSAEPAQRRLAAILACDICGYSRVMGASEAQAVRLVEHLSKLAESAIARYEGRMIKRMGNGVIIEFPSAVTATECARAMQARLVAYNAQAPEAEQFQIRIGIHLGEVVETQNDTLGDGINIAARLEPLAPTGGICLSEDVYRQIQNQAHLKTVPMGRKPLKNIDRPIAVYRLLHEGESPMAARLRVTPRRVTAAVAAALCLLLFIGIGKNLAQRGRDQQSLGAALLEAKRLADAGDLEAAGVLLDKTAGTTPAKTPGYDKLEEARTRLHDALTRVELHNRYMDFTRIWISGDRKRVTEFFEPSSKLRQFTPRQRQRPPKRAGAVPDEMRVVKIDMNPAADAATVTAQARYGAAWKDTPQSRWKLIDGVWYVTLKPAWLE